jgi:hypothetical protein
VHAEFDRFQVMDAMEREETGVREGGKEGGQKTKRERQT